MSPFSKSNHSPISLTISSVPTQNTNIYQMMKEEGENGRDDMLIDDPQQVEDEGFNSNYLKVYYGMLFPHEDMSKWMSYRNDGKHPACDQSYFRRKELCSFKIHIGPVYNVDPSKRHANAASGDNIFAPVERELVFDIDILDYDDARYCCSRADVCLDCWPLMTIAIKVVDTALRDKKN